MLSLFECITHSSSLPLEKIKLIGIVNWIFHVSGFLILFRMSFKYGLVLSRYSSTDSVFFYHRYSDIQYSYYSKNYLFLLVYNKNALKDS